MPWPRLLDLTATPNLGSVMDERPREAPAAPPCRPPAFRPTSRAAPFVTVAPKGHHESWAAHPGAYNELHYREGGRVFITEELKVSPQHMAPGWVSLRVHPWVLRAACILARGVQTGCAALRRLWTWSLLQKESHASRGVQSPSAPPWDTCEQLCRPPGRASHPGLQVCLCRPWSPPGVQGSRENCLHGSGWTHTGTDVHT